MRTKFLSNYYLLCFTVVVIRDIEIKFIFILLYELNIIFRLNLILME